ncbi:MAG: hypothetical protein ACK46X_11850 [Candidatus Sericytochromatia bacterium]
MIRYAMLLTVCAVITPVPALAAQPAAPFQLAAADGVDFDDEEHERTSSSRTGHAPYTPAGYQAELGKLPTDQRIAVRSILGKLDATTKKQLEALIANRRVQYKDATGHTLIDNLWSLVDKPLKHKIKNAELITEVIRDVGRPSTIAQAAHNTCTATSIQSAMARSAPGEYARIISGLAAGDGVVTARNGKLKLSSADYIPFKDRTVTGNLFQPAVMEAEAQHNGNGAHYDNKTDTTRNNKGEKWQGAMDADVSFVQTALMVGKYETIYAENTPKPKLVAILRGATAKRPVLVGFYTAGGGGHEVQVVGFDKAKNKYKIRNPWGELIYLPIKDVETHADGVNYRKD